MLKCLLAAVSLERDANPVMHLFHLGEVAVAALPSSGVLCISATLQSSWVGGSGCKPANPLQSWVLSQIQASLRALLGLVEPAAPSLTSAMFSLSGALLVIYPIALDAAGQTGVREMGSRSLWRSAGIGFNQALTWDCWFSSGKGTEQAFNF